MYEVIIYDKRDKGKPDPGSTLGHRHTPIEAAEAAIKYMTVYPEMQIWKIEIVSSV